MRKIFTFLFAALMSAGMMAAVTPKGTDVWDETTKTLTVNGNPASNAYIGVSDIENLVISDAVTSIGDNAFENCNGLKSVSFGSSLASIGKEAFASCVKLESVTLPASLESIGKSAFSQCDGLTSVTITNGLTSIGQQAFYNCEKLATVTIPNSVASIGMNAFGNCDGLTEIVVAAENPNYSSADGVLFNKDKTTLIQCPGGKQGEYTVPNSVTSIGNNAFASCYLLTSVEIPNSVGEIGVQAFSSCVKLESVTIGNGVTSIGGYAFYYSSKLASVTINATTPPTLGGSALDKTAAALTIYVPAASVTDYKGAWTAYADKIEAISGGDEPAGVTVVFAANDKTVERTVTLPHDFSCSYSNRDGELDAIIKELYEISAGHCSDDNYPVASGNEAVTAGSNDFDNYITISAAFEGTATVSGVYWNSDAYDGDGDWMDYTLTISIKGDEPEPQPATTVVTITDSDFPSEGQSFTKDGVTVSAVEIDGSWGSLLGGGSFSTTLGNFTKIEVSANLVNISGEGWSGDYEHQTWTGNASSVSFSGDIYGDGVGVTLKFTIESQGGETAVENVQTNHVQSTKFFRDGQLLIEKNGKLYNATGAEVK